MKILVIGAGLSGSVIARCLAEKGHQIILREERDHIAGNCYDYLNRFGIFVHQYGPHLFHTSNEKVVSWLSRFTEWVPYKHKVKALLKDNSYVTLPVNKATKAIVGNDAQIIETFFRPYTEKMWGLPLEEVSPNILNRVPVRNDLNEYYFPNDAFQALPAKGYSSLVSLMLQHENIQVILNSKFLPGQQQGYDLIFNSMPIDEFFNFKYGALPYRSIRFHYYEIPVPSILPAATVNFTHAGPFTRVTEWKKLPNNSPFPNSDFWTEITIEEPCSYLDNNKERFYPIHDKAGCNQNLYEQYRREIPDNMFFIGRCGLYRYINMDEAVQLSLELIENI